MKSRVVAKLLPPESATLEAVSAEVGISASTLERWRSEVLSMPARERAWTAVGKLDAIIITAALDETGQSAWCREHGLYPVELDRWRQGAIHGLADPGETRASPKETQATRKRVLELERELNRKEKALAETAALLVLSKKLSVVFRESVGV